MFRQSRLLELAPGSVDTPDVLLLIRWLNCSPLLHPAYRLTMPKAILPSPPKVYGKPKPVNKPAIQPLRPDGTSFNEGRE